MAAILCPLVPCDLRPANDSRQLLVPLNQAKCRMQDCIHCISGPWGEKDGGTEGGRRKSRGGGSRIVVSVPFVSFPAPVLAQVHKASVHIVQAAEAR